MNKKTVVTYLRNNYTLKQKLIQREVLCLTCTYMVLKGAVIIVTPFVSPLNIDN